MANSPDENTALNLVSVQEFEQQNWSGRIVSLAYFQEVLKREVFVQGKQVQTVRRRRKEERGREREREKNTPKVSSGQGGLPETKTVVRQ